MGIDLVCTATVATQYLQDKYRRHIVSETWSVEVLGSIRVVCIQLSIYLFCAAATEYGVSRTDY